MNSVYPPVVNDEITAKKKTVLIVINFAIRGARLKGKRTRANNKLRAPDVRRGFRAGRTVRRNLPNIRPRTVPAAKRVSNVVPGRLSKSRRARFVRPSGDPISEFGNTKSRWTNCVCESAVRRFPPESSGTDAREHRAR